MHVELARSISNKKKRKKKNKGGIYTILSIALITSNLFSYSLKQNFLNHMDCLINFMWIMRETLTPFRHFQASVYIYSDQGRLKGFYYSLFTRQDASFCMSGEKESSFPNFPNDKKA